jgi:hypothetical protein
MSVRKCKAFSTKKGRKEREERGNYKQKKNSSVRLKERK